MPLPTPLTAVVLILSLACSLAWGKPPLKSRKDNTAPPSAEQQDIETISDFLPDTRRMEVNLTSTLCSGLWTHSTHESCFPPNPQPLYKCQYCARTCKSKGGLTHHEKKCKSRVRPPQSESIPVVSPSHDGVDLDEKLVLNGKPVLDEEAPLTLAECSRLVSSYIKPPEWQDFLVSGRHTTNHRTAVNTGWAGLKLDTVSPADKETPFPALTAVALERLMQLSPSISSLYHQLQTGVNPLADSNGLREFIKNTDHNELFARGNHSLVIKWRKGPGYVFKIARSGQDHIRLTREQNLYLLLRDPDNILLNLTTTPMTAAFSVSGKPVLALRQIDGTARDRLHAMREHHSLNERLNFALSVVFHFCQMYRRFLDKDVLLADRHDDNIGFNEIPLQGRKSMELDDAIIQVPVMLDLDPYWIGGQELRELQLYLPTWVPVAVGLLEEVFTPRSSCTQISQSRVTVIDKIRKFAAPDFSSFTQPEPKGDDIEPALRSCVNHWFQDINPEFSELLTEARSHIEPLLNSLNQWDPAPRTVAEWNKKLREETGRVLRWLNNWKKETEFSLLKDFTDEGIIKIPSVRGGTFPRDQEILTLLSMIHGRLGCRRCTRTFTTDAKFTKHWQLHQQEKLHHCGVCGGDYIAITEHERMHTGERPYECQHCGKTCLTNSALQRHLRTHSGDKPYKCQYCDKYFSYSGNLKEHLRTHSGDRPFKCEQCGKYFSHASTLKNHLRTHSGDKPFKCEQCGKGFSQNATLRNHLRTHSGDKPFKCEQCGKGFFQASNLQVHLRIHSGDKPCKCEHCGKCFAQASTLRSHLRTHSGDKPYKCEHCRKRFSQSSNLKVHLRIHSGDKPYNCRHCGKCFRYADSLTKHALTHSRDKP